MVTKTDKLIKNICKELGHPEKTEEMKAKHNKKSDGPKKPKNRFMLFCDARRLKYKEDGMFRDLKMIEMSQKLSKDWKELSEEEKAAYST